MGLWKSRPSIRIERRELGSRKQKSKSCSAEQAKVRTAETTARDEGEQVKKHS